MLEVNLDIVPQIRAEMNLDQNRMMDFWIRIYFAFLLLVC